MRVRRRALLLLGLAASTPRAGAAEDADLAAAERFIRDAGNRLAAVTRDDLPPAERQRRVAALLEELVDVDGVAKFCLGRFWRTATPDQRRDYLALFRDVLARAVTLRTGGYASEAAAGSVRVTTATPMRDGELIDVPTTVERPHNAPAHVTWVVEMRDGQPRIADVKAEGISLRLTQRSDYAAFLARNGNDIGALLDALRRQAAAPAQ